jgi:hypothetical protein
LEYQHMEYPKYRQCHMKDEADFMPYLSVLDLVMNEGPASSDIIRAC